MDFGDSPDEAAFRSRLRAWRRDNNLGLPASSTSDDCWAGRAWHQALYDAGFFGLSWPTGIGGRALPSVYDSRAQSVTGGTSQIQHNLVATRILELPT